MTVVTEILNGLQNIDKPQQKILQVLFSTMFACHSAINFLSLSRYCGTSERTFRRGFRRPFDFPAFNLPLVEQAADFIPQAVARDASFIPKSGKRTFGLDKFRNGSHSRAEKGLEVSLLAVLDPVNNCSLALSAEQTPAQKALPGAGQETRIDFYLSDFRRRAPRLPAAVRHVVVDGFYAKEKFVSGICADGYQVISRRRSAANWRFLFTGALAGGRGRPRKYDGKVDFSDLSRLEPLETDEPRQWLYTARVWSVSLKREIRLLVLVSANAADKQKPVVLFSTDLELAAAEILRLYRARF